MKHKDKVYVFKDPDGYFIGVKGTPFVKRITWREYEFYKTKLEEWGVKKR